MSCLYLHACEPATHNISREERKPKITVSKLAVEEEEEEEEETAPEKRLRLAKQYITQVEEEGGLCVCACVCVL